MLRLLFPKLLYFIDDIQKPAYNLLISISFAIDRDLQQSSKRLFPKAFLEKTYFEPKESRFTRILFFLIAHGEAKCRSNWNFYPKICNSVSSGTQTIKTRSHAIVDRSEIVELRKMPERIWKQTRSVFTSDESETSLHGGLLLVN